MQPQPGMQPQHPGHFMQDLATHAPQSKPGTLFGIPLSTLRDQVLEQKVLLISGILIAAGIFIPYMTTPKVLFGWSEYLSSRFEYLVWPLIAAVCYLAVALSPKTVKDNIPPVVLKWVPFTVSLLSIGIIGVVAAVGVSHSNGLLLQWGYPVMCFGLLGRLARPQDHTARIIAAVGAGLMVPFTISFLFDVAFHFKGVGALGVIHNLLFLVVLLLAVISISFVFTKQVPALKPLESFAPLVTAVVLAWVPVQAIILMLAIMSAQNAGTGLVMGLHMLINALGYFGVLMLSAPEAYDELMKLFGDYRTQTHHQQGGYPPQQQGGYPPQQQGGYPPQQQGGYPPQQQGGYPPQQQGGPIQPQMPPQQPPGGYPPQGGGGGGGWPQQ